VYSNKTVSNRILMESRNLHELADRIKVLETQLEVLRIAVRDMGPDNVDWVSTEAQIQNIILDLEALEEAMRLLQGERI
jgi:hypothetical protein